MELSERIYNGNRAKEVLENESFQWAINEIKTEVTDQWKNSPARDEAGRECLWTLLKVAETFEMDLQATLETGTLASLDLEHKRSLMQRMLNT